MKIRATFVWPSYAEGPELACAWDEYCIDANDEGWAEERAKRIASYGDELDPTMVRDVDLVVDYDRLERLFLPVEIDADISAP